MAAHADRFTFLAARGAIVLARPLALIIAARVLGKDSANEFAQAIVAVGFGLIASAFDSGRLFYEAALGAGLSRAIAFHRYLWRLAVSGTVGAAVVAVLMLRSSADTTTLAAAVAYFVTERVTDERQRYLLVDSRIRDWSAMQLLRGSLQVALTAMALAAILWAGHGSAAWLLVGLSAANLVALPAIRGVLMAARTARAPWTAARLAGRGASMVRLHRALWASGLMAATIGYGDRLMIALWDGPDTASLVVTCSCLALQSVVISTFFFTPRRAAIVRQEVPMSAFASMAYLGPAALGLGAGAAFAAASLAVFAGEARAPAGAIAAAGAASVAATLAGVVREVAYYRSPGGTLAAIDGAALAIAATATTAAWAAGMPVSVGFIALAATQIARVAILWRFANGMRQPKAGPATKVPTER